VAWAGVAAAMAMLEPTGRPTAWPPGRIDAPIAAAAVFAFILRDVAVIAFFRFGPRPKRGDFGAVVALGLLYGLGGAVLSVVGDEARALTWPSTRAPLLSLASALLQAGGIGFLALRRIGAPERSDLQA